MATLRQMLLGFGVLAVSISLFASPARAAGVPGTASSPVVVTPPFFGGDPVVWFYLRRVAWDAIQREAAQRQMVIQEMRYRQAQHQAHLQRLQQEAWYRAEIGRQQIRKQMNQRPAVRSGAAAPRPKDEGPSAEQRANAKLKLARLLLAEGHKADAREYCQGIIANYGGTPAAAEATTLLEQAK